ncbi:MAG TPA: hypothetical protein DEA96_12560 [Leptospiraceae bacterium]|nr:hypothetical protein [Leptospiraceae bacterium]
MNIISIRGGGLFTCLILILVASLCSSCQTFRENPDLGPCKVDCVEKQNECMLQATSSPEIDHCKEALAKCILRCEREYP